MGFTETDRCEGMRSVLGAGSQNKSHYEKKTCLLWVYMHSHTGCPQPGTGQRAGLNGFPPKCREYIVDMCIPLIQASPHSAANTLHTLHYKHMTRRHQIDCCRLPFSSYKCHNKTCCTSWLHVSLGDGSHTQRESLDLSLMHVCIQP